jgi:hypothetical protein
LEVLGGRPGRRFTGGAGIGVSRSSSGLSREGVGGLASVVILYIFFDTICDY